MARALAILLFSQNENKQTNKQYLHDKTGAQTSRAKKKKLVYTAERRCRCCCCGEVYRLESTDSFVQFQPCRQAALSCLVVHRLVFLLFVSFKKKKKNTSLAPPSLLAHFLLNHLTTCGSSQRTFAQVAFRHPLLSFLSSVMAQDFFTRR